MIYTYFFIIWPNETWDWEKSLFETFKLLNIRIEMEFTEEEFNKYLSSMNRQGFTLREIERVPYHTPENIIL